MSEIKSIIFDMGGVYLDGSFIDFVNAAYKILGIDRTFYTAEEVTFDDGYNRGRIDVENCFRKYFNVPISDEQMERIKEIWTSTWHPSPEMVDLVRSLKPNYRLAVLSNSDALNSEAYFKKGWYSYFDPIILSHEVGFLKPEREIYDIALQKIGLPAVECLFIDDQSTALAPAAAMGMETIRFLNADQLKSELNAKGIAF